MAETKRGSGLLCDFPHCLMWPLSLAGQSLSVLDFERSIILHLPKMTPKQVLIVVLQY